MKIKKTQKRLRSLFSSVFRKAWHRVAPALVDQEPEPTPNDAKQPFSHKFLFKPSTLPSSKWRRPNSNIAETSARPQLHPIGSSVQLLHKWLMIFLLTLPRSPTPPGQHQLWNVELAGSVSPPRLSQDLTCVSVGFYRAELLIISVPFFIEVT